MEDQNVRDRRKKGIKIPNKEIFEIKIKHTVLE
jgi:hypothetical protein